ncbi:unnamed protein product [Diplocarpon coronariae]
MSKTQAEPEEYVAVNHSPAVLSIGDVPPCFSISPSRFHCFGLLPAELRHEIWRLLLPSKRVVKVDYNIQTGRFYTSTPLPANMRVCRESRLKAMDLYPLHFGTLGHPAMVRANLEIDIIQLDWDPLRLNTIPRQTLKQIRHLKLGGRELQRASTDTILARLQDFRSLEIVYLVSPPAELDYSMYAGHYYRLIMESGAPDTRALPGRIHAELLGYKERRTMAFTQYNNLAQAMRGLARISKRWRCPRLMLDVTSATGENVCTVERQL